MNHDVYLDIYGEYGGSTSQPSTSESVPVTPNPIPTTLPPAQDPPPILHGPQPVPPPSVVTQPSKEAAFPQGKDVPCLEPEIADTTPTTNPFPSSSTAPGNLNRLEKYLHKHKYGPSISFLMKQFGTRVLVERIRPKETSKQKTELTVFDNVYGAYSGQGYSKRPDDYQTGPLYSSENIRQHVPEAHTQTTIETEKTSILANPLEPNDSILFYADILIGHAAFVETDYVFAGDFEGNYIVTTADLLPGDRFQICRSDGVVKRFHVVAPEVVGSTMNVYKRFKVSSIGD